MIRSLNADKPYDQFLLEQIAGDELFEYKATQQLTPVQLDTLAAKVEMLSSTVMGLTMACATCHDHKFDPIAQRSSTP